MLNFLASKGYKVSNKKVQISKETVKYLGLIISKGAPRSPSRKKKKYVSQPHQGPTRSHVGLGEWLVGHICIPNFGLIMKPPL